MYRAVSKELSASKERPFTCSTPSLGMPIQAMAAYPHRFCWSNERKDVPHISGCAFQVARGSGNVQHISSQHHPTTPIIVCNYLSNVYQTMDHLSVLCSFLRSSPYQPAINGLAERFVQTFKRALVTSRSITALLAFNLLIATPLMQPPTILLLSYFLKENCTPG